MKLNGPLTGGGNVLSFLIEPTSGSGVYMADQAVDGQNELYVAEFMMTIRIPSCHFAMASWE